MGVGAYFALSFLINSQWILAVITTIVTLGWVGVMNRIGKRQRFQPLFPEYDEKELISWESIEIFNTSNSEHLSLGYPIDFLCWEIAQKLGSREDIEYQYQDDIITIRLNNSSIRVNNSYSNYLKVSLTFTDQVVFETQRQEQSVNEGTTTVTIFKVFHVGTWIDHVNSFKARIKQVYAEEAEKRQQDYLRDQQERFGRID
ncbi:MULTISPECIES: hypothetical protein [unclassified Nostoc]|uniref:hypothetical protein n=1 Tax=unclassified Nostoc TaxID=2593658 RepID=UPI002AD4D41E|nr:MULTISPECIES: hypothetical protein [unclassified Nostoc]MDZ8120727.1 hypothetical protein [Nostoc sp. CmiVER01]MDZ8222633.1 hypothetical protein [Nostoc sp. ChiVER01]